MSERYFGVAVPEPTNTIRLPWTDGTRYVLHVWVRVNGRIFREDAGVFELDREKRVLVFKAFKIEPRDQVMIGGTSVNILEALAEVAQG